jgi:hypothetical protein
MPFLTASFAGGCRQPFYDRIRCSNQLWQPVGKLIQFRKPRRLTPQLLEELLRIHMSCVHDQEGRCGLLASVASLCWEINQVCNIGNEEDNAFKHHDEMCAARPLTCRFNTEEVAKSITED